MQSPQLLPLPVGGGDMVGGGDDALIANDTAEYNEAQFIHQPNPNFD